MSGLWNDITSVCNQIYNILPGVPTKEIETIVVKEVDSMLQNRAFVRVAGLSGALSVALAAYGAHGFNHSGADPKLKEIFETANKIHMIHSVALLASPLARRSALVGTLFTGGIILFSGSCYYHALTGNVQIRAVTPFGGMMLIFAWLAAML